VAGVGTSDAYLWSLIVGLIFLTVNARMIISTSCLTVYGCCLWERGNEGKGKREEFLYPWYCL